MKIVIKTSGFTKPSLIFKWRFSIKIFNRVVTIIQPPNPQIRESTPKNPLPRVTTPNKITPPKMLFMKLLTSKLKAFKILLVMLLSPKGIIIHAARAR